MRTKKARMCQAQRDVRLLSNPGIVNCAHSGNSNCFRALISKGIKLCIVLKVQFNVLQSASTSNDVRGNVAIYLMRPLDGIVC